MPSPWLIIFAILIFLGVITAIILLVAQPKEKKQTSGDLQFPYSKQTTLFTPAEHAFFDALQQAVGDEAQIFGKVRVADVIMPQKGMSRSEWHRAFNKISAKHFDFVLCHKQDLSVICVVELNDATHQKLSRQKRDMFLVAACQSASVPLVQVPVKSSYDIDKLREQLLQ